MEVCDEGRLVKWPFVYRWRYEQEVRMREMYFDAQKRAYEKEQVMRKDYKAFPLLVEARALLLHAKGTLQVGPRGHRGHERLAKMIDDFCRKTF